MITKAAAIKALSKRLATSAATQGFDLSVHLFQQQLDFVNDEASYKVAVCSRRAGKSTSVAADIINTASKTPNCTVLYITGTRTDAKKIIWNEVLKFNREYKMGGKPNNSELTVAFPNGSIVRLAGAKDEQEIEKIRGQMPPVKKVFIDESQSIRDRVLVKLIDDVLEAALLDLNGSICLLGTPGAIKAGYFYRISHNQDENGHPLPEDVWSTHKWTYFDNPHIATKSKRTHQELLDRVLKRRGITVTHPSVRREYFGEWESDTDTLLLNYDPNRNNFTQLPELNSKKPWHYILGIDVGFNDADALAVLAWHEDSPTTFLVEEMVTAQQGITELVNQVLDLSKRYDFSKMVIDSGGGGKKLAEEMRKRHQIPVEAAEKTRKMEYLQLLDDALRTGRFKAHVNSRFAQDTYLVEIDYDKSTPDKIAISTKYHSDIIDAVLYASRESPAYAYAAPALKVLPQTDAWYKAEEDRMFQASVDEIEKQKLAKQNEEWWRDYE